MTHHPLHRHPGLNLGPLHDDVDGKNETMAFGFWVFLMSDMIVFGVLLATYASALDPMGLAGAPGPSQLFNLQSVAIQTLFLLFGGAAYGGVSLSLKYDTRVSTIIGWLLICALFGAGFLAFEGRDFVHQAAQGGIPQASGWLSAYWTLVGLHGIHVAIGVLWIAVMIAQLAMRGVNTRAKTRLTLLGLYWHFLDIIWIGIFSFVFLVPMI